MSADIELARLLEHPAIWRGRSAARAEVLPTGFAAFDECLPGKGWPRCGLIEILVPRFGVGELNVLLPALAGLTRRPGARWCVWTAPPFEPFAPALVAHGVALENVLVVRAGDERAGQDAQSEKAKALSTSVHSRGRMTSALWAFEQVLGSGACDLAMAWLSRPGAREIRRLQLAAERGRGLGVLFRPRSAARESSPAMLRVLVEPVSQDVSLTQRVRVTLLKSRGGARGSIELAWEMTGGQLAGAPAIGSSLAGS
jgi:hypothetical protein